MSGLLEQAVKALNKKLGHVDFDGVAKFLIADKGSVIIDGNGARISNADADVTLSASVEVFQAIMDGDQNATSAFMTGELSINGDMGTALKLARILQ
jgi:putative sterol carrier protein